MTHPQPAPGTPGAAEPSAAPALPVPRPVHVVLAGGGTGGHVEPMLALADALAAAPPPTAAPPSGSPAWAPPAAWRPGWSRPAATTCG